MKNILFILGCVALLISCNEKGGEAFEKPNETPNEVNTIHSEGPEYTVITVEYPSIGWGYQILQDGKLAIDQKHIPVIQGYKRFSSKEKAEKTANFIVEKMKKGFFPPTLTEKELDSLEVL